MSTEAPTIWYLVSGLLFAVLLYFIWHYLAELNFYRKSSWDFSIHNPRGRKLYWGDEPDPQDSNLMTNATRIWFGYPLFIAVTLIIFLAFVYPIWSGLVAAVEGWYRA